MEYENVPMVGRVDVRVFRPQNTQEGTPLDGNHTIIVRVSADNNHTVERHEIEPVVGGDGLNQGEGSP